MASARLRGRWRRAEAAWRVAEAGTDTDAQRAALAVLAAATEATLAYIHAMIDGKDPHQMGRVAKRMAGNASRTAFKAPPGASPELEGA